MPQRPLHHRKKTTRILLLLGMRHFKSTLNNALMVQDFFFHALKSKCQLLIENYLNWKCGVIILFHWHHLKYTWMHRIAMNKLRFSKSLLPTNNGTYWFPWYTVLVINIWSIFLGILSYNFTDQLSDMITLSKGHLVRWEPVLFKLQRQIDVCLNYNLTKNVRSIYPSFLL